MMPAKHWCDNGKGFESGLGAWGWMSENGNVRQLFLRVQPTVMMNVASVFPRNDLQLGPYANSAALRAAFLQWCYSSRNFAAAPTVSAGNGAGADDDNRMQVDSLKKGWEKGNDKHQNQKGTRIGNTSNTDINTCKNCGRTGHWVKDCWRPSGGAYDSSISNNGNANKGNNNKKGPGKGKHLDVVETNRHRARSELSRAIQKWNRNVSSWE